MAEGSLGLILVGGVAFAVLLLIAIIVLFLKLKRGKIGAKSTVEDKIRPYIDHEYIKKVVAAEERAKEDFKLIKAAGEKLTKFEFMAEYREAIGLKLLKAGMRIKPQEFIVINVIVTVMIGGIAFIIPPNSLTMAVGGLVGGFFLPHLMIYLKKSGRVKAFNNQLCDALSLMSNSLKAGYGFMQAVQLISEEMPPPIGEEFGRVVRENSLGVPLEDALQGMVDRVESEDLDLCMTAVIIQRQIGGNLAEILDSIAFTIRERIRIKGQIKTLTAQGRLGGMVIALLPLVLGLVMAMLQTEIMEHFVNVTYGRIMIGVALFMQGIGALVIKKVISIEV